MGQSPLKLRHCVDLTRPSQHRLTQRLRATRNALVSFCVLAQLGAASSAFAAEDSEATAPESAAIETAPGDAISPDTAEAARSRTLTRELAEQGENELNKAVRVFQQRYLVKRHRVELQVGGGMTINDHMVTHFAGDAGLFFHFTDQFALGVTGAKYAARDSAASNAVETNFGLFAERSHLQAGGMLEAQWAPLFGKFAVFGLGVVQVDGFLLAGGGVARTTRGTDLKPTGEIGIGVRLHMLRWLSLSADIRDVVYSETFQDCDTKSAGVCGKEVLNQWFTGLRIGIWIPPSFTYRFPR